MCNGCGDCVPGRPFGVFDVSTVHGEAHRGCPAAGHSGDPTSEPPGAAAAGDGCGGGRRLMGAAALCISNIAAGDRSSRTRTCASGSTGRTISPRDDGRTYGRARSARQRQRFGWRTGRLGGRTVREMLPHPAFTGDARAVRRDERIRGVLDHRAASGTNDPAKASRIVQAGNDLDCVGAHRIDRHGPLTPQRTIPLHRSCADGY
jgi:hypothetical protein